MGDSPRWSVIRPCRNLYHFLYLSTNFGFTGEATDGADHGFLPDGWWVDIHG